MTDLDLSVLDRRGEQAERAEAHLLAAPSSPVSSATGSRPSASTRPLDCLRASRIVIAVLAARRVLRPVGIFVERRCTGWSGTASTSYRRRRPALCRAAPVGPAFRAARPGQGRVPRDPPARTSRWSPATSWPNPRPSRPRSPPCAPSAVAWRRGSCWGRTTTTCRGRSTTWRTSAGSGSPAEPTRARARSWSRSSRTTAGTTSRTSTGRRAGRPPDRALGLDDAHIAWHDLRVAPRRSPDRFGFAVMHSPDSAPETAALGYDLIVAGHTHGGQVRLPGVGALVTNCSLPRTAGERLDP